MRTIQELYVFIIVNSTTALKKKKITSFAVDRNKSVNLE